MDGVHALQTLMSLFSHEGVLSAKLWFMIREYSLVPPHAW